MWVAQGSYIIMVKKTPNYSSKGGEAFSCGSYVTCVGFIMEKLLER